jgi:hypothetical protein
MITLNDEQNEAVELMEVHIRQLNGLQNPFFLLEGPAGSGKTACLAVLKERVKKRFVFTAPTNKAVKVLREVIDSADYKGEYRTIYSLLGLTMQANGEVKELVEPEEEIDLTTFSAVVVDEGSMLNRVILAHIAKAATKFPNLRWIVMGDRWQLPPVGEDWSQIWEADWPRAKLTKIMRQDNQILRLSAAVREQIAAPYKAFNAIRSDNADGEGVWALSAIDFQHRVVDDSASFLSGRAKCINWRNAKVDFFNALIRKQLFADPDLYPWQPGDRITMLGPIKDLLKQNPETGQYPTVAATDDEGTVGEVSEAAHPMFPDFKCWRITWTSDFNKVGVLWVLHKREQGRFVARTTRLAEEARADRRKWKDFWEFKDAFHPVRHAYAITAHRAQGSTYERAYVNWRDVLLNQDRSEAYRCLYVAVTRPKFQLFLG